MSLMYRYRKAVVLTAIGVGFALLLASFVFFLRQQGEQKRLREQLQTHYEKQIEQLQTMEQAAQTRILVASRTVSSGTALQSGDVRSVEVPNVVAGPGSLKQPDEAIGKIVKIDLEPNTPIVASMLFADKPVPRDLRVQEFNVVGLPTNLQKGQFVDVRIGFPTGEDFIVLGKKKVRELAGATVWLEMNEPEILMASSAIIDAYLNGARLYALPYVDPGMQEAAVANYPSNPKVLDLMERDPNVLEEAKTALARQLRATLDNHLKAMSDADKMRVVSGNVTVQQQLQNERVTTQQNNAMQQSAQQQAVQQAGKIDQAGRQQAGSQTGGHTSGMTPNPSSSPAPISQQDSSGPGAGPLPEASDPDDQLPQTDKLDDIFGQPSSGGPSS